MGYPELRAAVEKPAEVVNLQFQAGIVDDLVKKVLGQPAALPLLQFTLQELWQQRDRNRITREVYDKVGDPLIALEKTADEFYGGLATQTRDEVRRILLELVRIDELLESYRQPVPVSRLLEAGKANTQEVLDLLEANDYVHVVHKVGARDAVAEIKHESLIRNWRTFIGWIDEKRRERRQRLALSQSAEHWANEGRPSVALLTGWQLQQAAQITDLSELEKDFVDASARAIEKASKVAQIRLVAVFSALLVLLVAFWAFDHFYIQASRKTRWVTEDLLQLSADDRQQFTENYLNGVAIYLWRKSARDPEALDELVRILKDADDRRLFAPDAYQVTAWRASESRWENSSGVQEEGPTILSISYPRDTGVSPSLLKRQWREFTRLAWGLGFPLPQRVSVSEREDDEAVYTLTIKRLDLPEKADAESPDASSVVRRSVIAKVAISPPVESINFRLNTGRPEPLNLQIKPDEILLYSRGLEGRAKELFEKYKREWQVREAFSDLPAKNWWRVPRWTIPIWTAAGHDGYYPPEAIIALRAVRETLRRPDILFSDGFVAALLQQQSSMTPATVKLACDAVGGSTRLIEETKARLAQGESWQDSEENPLSGLGNFLEDQISDASPPKPLAQEKCDFERMMRPIALTTETKFFTKELERSISYAFKPLPPLRVGIAEDLKQHLAPGGSLTADVVRRIELLRADIEHALGVRIPGIRFRVDDQLAAGHFRVQGRESTGQLPAKSAREVEDILLGVRNNVAMSRERWLDTEEVVRLVNSLPEDLRKWLEQNYSRAELRAILKQTISPDRSDRSASATEIAGDGFESPEASVSHLSWLMRSLVFWREVCAKQDYRCLGNGLRHTQAERIRQSMQGVRPIMQQASWPGIDALLNDRFALAATEFRRRTGTGRDAAMSDFAQKYAAADMSLAFMEMKGGCSPEFGRYAELLLDRARVNAFLDEYGQALREPLKSRMELCRIATRVQAAEASPDLANEIDRQFGLRPETWSADTKYWLSYLALKIHLDSAEAAAKAPPSRLKEIEALLTVTLRELPLQHADMSLEELAGLCGKPNAGAWCLQMLTGLAGVRQDSYWIPMAVAQAVVKTSHDGAQLALSLADQAERNLSRVRRGRQAEQKFWLMYLRGLAHLKLSEAGDKGELRKATDYFRRMTNPRILAIKNGPGAEEIYWELSEALQRAGDFPQARGVQEEGQAALKRSASGGEGEALRLQSVVLLLREGKFDEMVDFLGEAQDEPSLFLRSLGMILSQKPVGTDKASLNEVVDSALASSHPLKDYVRLMMYWKMMRDGDAQAAQKPLSERWQEISRAHASLEQSWNERTSADRGDYMAVWREMLIGYFLGRVPRQTIEEFLEKARKFENMAEQTRDGFLCEWHFYDALLQSVSGDPESRRTRLLSGLQAAIDTGQTGFYEFVMANAIVERSRAGEDLTLQTASSEDRR